MNNVKFSDLSAAWIRYQKCLRFMKYSSGMRRTFEKLCGRAYADVLMLQAQYAQEDK